MIADDFKPTDAERTAQQTTVLCALEQHPEGVDTQQLRAAGIAHPAGRVLELRRQGHDIATAKAGRFACYRLIRDAVTGAACVAGFAVVLGAAQAGGLAL